MVRTSVRSGMIANCFYHNLVLVRMKWGGSPVEKKRGKLLLPRLVFFVLLKFNSRLYD